MGEERAQLVLEERGDVLGVVGLVGLPEQQRGGPVRRGAEVGEEVRIARRHDGVGHKEPGRAMVGVQAVAPPWVVTQNHVGLQTANPARQLATLVDARLQLTVGVAEEHHVARTAERARRRPLLVLPGGDELGHGLIAVPRSLRPVGADQMRDRRAPCHPLGQRAAGPELDVVGMGADGQRTRRPWEVEAQFDVASAGRRSAGQSTS
jgi:hypothetical protein